MSNTDNEQPRGSLLPELPTTESGYWRWLIDNELVVDLDLDDEPTARRPDQKSRAIQ